MLYKLQLFSRRFLLNNYYSLYTGGWFIGKRNVSLRLLFTCVYGIFAIEIFIKPLCPNNRRLLSSEKYIAEAQITTYSF